MFNADEYKRANREQWQTTAQAWHDWMPHVSGWLREATDLMLDMAKVGPGDRVLDLAAGDGDQSLAAARRVGPAGYVLATDTAPYFVTLAEQLAIDERVTQLETRVMDAENLELENASFDAVICRLSLMYFPNLQRALSEARRVLKPGGRISAIVLTNAASNPFFSSPTTVIRSRAALPAPQPGQPGPFSLGIPDKLAGLLHAAGFGDIQERLLSAPLRMASAVECRQWRQETSGTLQQMLVGVDEKDRQSIWSEIERVLRQFEDPQGFESPAEFIICGGANVSLD